MFNITFIDNSNLNYRRFLFVDNFFRLMRHLLNQQMIMSSNYFLLINIWSLMALILSSCLSGGILSSLMFKTMKNINTIDELVQSNLTIINYNESWIWYTYDAEHRHNIKLDDNLRRIKNKLEYFSRDLFYNEVVAMFTIRYLN